LASCAALMISPRTAALSIAANARNSVSISMEPAKFVFRGSKCDLRHSLKVNQRLPRHNSYSEVATKSGRFLLNFSERINGRLAQWLSRCRPNQIISSNHLLRAASLLEMNAVAKNGLLIAAKQTHVVQVPMVPTGLLPQRVGFCDPGGEECRGMRTTVQVEPTKSSITPLAFETCD
jgi:hypothetical protein